MTNLAADQSPHQRQLLDRASRPDLRRWLDHTASTRGCVRPVRLTGNLHTVEQATGRIVRSRHTSELPDGVLYVPCGDRRASVCPPCAEIYRADTYQLIKAGLVGGKGVPTTVAGHPAVFATLTAPSFGPVHTRVVNPRSGTVRPCHPRRNVIRCPHGKALVCTQRHSDNAPSLGEPLCLDCYDHAHHVVWNGWAGELWRRTMIALNRSLRALEQAHGSSCGSPTARWPSTSAAESCTSTRSSASTASTLPLLTRCSPHRATSPRRTSPHWSPTPSNARCSGLRTTRTRATRGSSAGADSSTSPTRVAGRRDHRRSRRRLPGEVRHKGDRALRAAGHRAHDRGNRRAVQPTPTPISAV